MRQGKIENFTKRDMSSHKIITFPDCSDSQRVLELTKKIQNCTKNTMKIKTVLILNTP